MKIKGRKYLSTEKFAVEESYEGEIRRILMERGFTKIEKMPYQFLFDFQAKYDGNKAFIEVKTRGAKAQTRFFFTLRERKIEQLKKLTKVGVVFILFINNESHRLIQLEDLLSGKTDMESMKVSFFKDKKEKKRTIMHKVWYLRHSGLREEVTKNDLNDSLRIHTTKEVKDIFNDLQKTHGFKRKHDFFVWLLN